MKTLEIMRRDRVIGVIRAQNSTHAKVLAEACIAGGIRLIEITFSFSGVEGVISSLTKNKEIQVGAGTVLDLEMAGIAISSGADFIVSPHTDAKIINFAKSRGIVAISGALSSSEVISAWKLGADLIKIFPIKTVGGPLYVRAIKETLPFIEIMTTGGVRIDDFTEYLNAGATLVGLSSDLIGSDPSLDLNEVTARAKKVVGMLSVLEG